MKSARSDQASPRKRRKSRLSGTRTTPLRSDTCSKTRFTSMTSRRRKTLSTNEKILATQMLHSCSAMLPTSIATLLHLTCEPSRRACSKMRHQTTTRRLLTSPRTATPRTLLIKNCKATITKRRKKRGKEKYLMTHSGRPRPTVRSSTTIMTFSRESLPCRSVERPLGLSNIDRRCCQESFHF